MSLWVYLVFVVLHFPLKKIQLHLYFSKLIRVLKISKKKPYKIRKNIVAYFYGVLESTHSFVLQMLLLKSERIRGHKKGIESSLQKT